MSSGACAAQGHNVKEVFDKLTQLVKNEQSPSLAIQNAEMLLKNYDNVNNGYECELSQTGNKYKWQYWENEAIQQGTPAFYLTFSDLIERRKERKIEQGREQQRKAEP